MDVDVRYCADKTDSGFKQPKHSPCFHTGISSQESYVLDVYKNEFSTQLSMIDTLDKFIQSPYVLLAENFSSSKSTKYTTMSSNKTVILVTGMYSTHSLPVYIYIYTQINKTDQKSFRCQ